ncbi:hypothetical protein EGP34_12375 [Neisseria gonorrhoeae]|nr:hypothetical protein EGP34_12375 [Neisseria gonorrhoeae]
MLRPAISINPTCLPFSSNPSNPPFRPPGPTQPNRHSHGSGNLGRGVWATVLSDKFPCGQVRIPACAGMTGFEITAFAVSGTGKGVFG